MYPVVRGIPATKRAIFAYSILMVACSLLPFMLGDSGTLYSGAAMLLGGYFLLAALRVLRSDATRDAMRLFGFSILYLFALFGALVVDYAIR